MNTKTSLRKPSDTAEGVRGCPVCGSSMVKETVHTIQIDVCKQHGLWLDKGELAAICDIIRGNENAARDKELREATRNGKVEGAFWGWMSLLFD